MDPVTVEERVSAACEALWTYDATLLELGAGERAVAGRLFHYLIGLFPSHDVDLEYNRHGKATKEIDWPGDCREKDRPRVVPDIVIHKRGNDDTNLVVIEIKRSNDGQLEVECDRQKLAALVQQYRYQHSLLLTIPIDPSKEPAFEWHHAFKH